MGRPCVDGPPTRKSRSERPSFNLGRTMSPDSAALRPGPLHRSSSSFTRSLTFSSGKWRSSAATTPPVFANGCMFPRAAATPMTGLPPLHGKRRLRRDTWRSGPSRSAGKVGVHPPLCNAKCLDLFLRPLVLREYGPGVVQHEPCGLPCLRRFCPRQAARRATFFWIALPRSARRIGRLSATSDA